MTEQEFKNNLKTLNVPFVENSRDIYLAECPYCSGHQTLGVSKSNELFTCFQCQNKGSGFNNLLKEVSDEYKVMCNFEEFIKKHPEQKQAKVPEVSISPKTCECNSRDLFNYGCRCGGS